MRFLHAADIHLDSPLDGLRQRAGARGDELAGATRRAFQNLVQFAIDQRVELLLIAGDNYDGRHRDYGSVLFFAREMDRLQRAGVRVVMIRGNHDAENQMELRMPPGIHLLRADQPDSIHFDDLGVAVHGQSYARRDVRKNLVANYPEPVAGYLNIGLLHTAVDGYGGAHERYAPCTVADLVARNYDYWALGHVHERNEPLRTSGRPASQAADTTAQPTVEETAENDGETAIGEEEGVADNGGTDDAPRTLAAE